MSDFGAIISISKKEKVPFCEKEFLKIKVICEQIKSETKLTNSFSDPYLFNVGRTKYLGSDECLEVNVLLSNHWGSASDFDWHKEVEIKDMKTITDSLCNLLPREYELKSSFAWW